MVAIPFVGQAYKERSPDANAQTCINLSPARSPTADNPNRMILSPTPGYQEYLDTKNFGIAGTGEIRATLVINGALFVVSGAKFLRINAGGTVTELGALTSTAGRCSIDTNTVEIVVSDGASGYVYNLGTGVFSTISGGSWPVDGVTNFTFQDSYILAACNNSKRVIQSGLLNAGSYGAQAFAEVTSFPDNLVAAFSDQNQLYLFGPKLTEVRFNSGATPFAFEKTQGVLIQAGLVAWPTLLKIGGTLIWLASDADGKAYVAALEGYDPKPISTPAINEALERYSVISDAFSWSYREGDGAFYCITFPTEGVTWVLDLQLKMWHQRQAPDDGPDYPQHCVQYLGRHLVGGKDGRLMLMSQDYPLAADGGYLKRKRACQHFSAENTSLFLYELHIDIEAGVGLLQPQQGDEPLATLRISKDGGHTWHSGGTARIGRMGQYRHRLSWRRLGRGYRWAFELTVTDPVRVTVLGADAKFTAGTK